MTWTVMSQSLSMIRVLLRKKLAHHNISYTSIWKEILFLFNGNFKMDYNITLSSGSQPFLVWLLKKNFAAPLDSIYNLKSVNLNNWLSSEFPSTWQSLITLSFELTSRLGLSLLLLWIYPRPILNQLQRPSPFERGLSSASYYVCKQSLRIKCDAVSIVSTVIKLS